MPRALGWFALCWAVALLWPVIVFAQPFELEPNLKAAFSSDYTAEVDTLNTQSTGKVLAAGFFSQVNGQSANGLVRLSSKGVVDPSFTPPIIANPKNIMVQADDKIVVQASYMESLTGTLQWSLFRLDTDGTRDDDFKPGFTGVEVAVSTMQEDGKTVVGGMLLDWTGMINQGDDVTGVARLTTGGTADATFSCAVVNGGSHAYLRALLVQGDGKILVAGVFSGINGAARNGLARLNSNGTLDTSFDPGAGPSVDGYVGAMAEQSDGKIVIGGSFTTYGGQARANLARLNSDGSLDEDFQPQLSGGTYGTDCTGLQVTPDGRIIVGGSFTTVNGEAVNNFAVLNSNGTLDAFSTPAGGGADDQVYHVSIKNGSQLLVGGRFSQLAGQSRSCMGRFELQPQAGYGQPGIVFDQSPGPQRRIGLPQGQVNTASLGLVAKGTLFRMRSLGPAVDLTLCYTAWPGLETGIFGRWWRSTYESNIRVAGQLADLVRGSGRRLTYSTTGDLSGAGVSTPVAYTPPQGVSDRLACHGDYYLWTEMATRNIYRYDPSVDDADTYRLTSITDKNGNAVTIEYYAGTDHIRYVTGPVEGGSTGRKLEFTYSGDYCTKVSMPDGRSITAAYDGEGNLTSLTDMAGYVGAYTYDTDGYLTRMTTAGKATAYTFADRTWMAGKYVSQVDYPSGESVTYAVVSEDGSSTKRVGADGQETVYTSDGGKTASVQDPTGALRQLSWVGDLLAAYSAPTGGEWKYEYDDDGNLIRIIDAYSGWWDFAYDEDDRMISRKDPQGHTWWYQYDSNGNLIRLTDPSGGVTKLTYDSQGWLIRVTDANDNETEYARDIYGNLIAITDPLDNVTTYSYWSNDDYLRPYKLTDARGKEKHFEYDDNDRLTKIGYGPAPYFAQVVNTYDATGQLTHRDELSHLYQVERNGEGLVTKLTDPLGWVTSYGYDGEGRITTITAPQARESTTAYDAAGRVSREEDPLHHYTERSYNASGNLVTFSDQNHHVTRFTYDLNGRLRTVRDPLDNVVTHTYDTAWRRESTTNARGQDMAFTYDANGRLLSRSLDGGRVESWTYDPAGNLTTATGAEGTTTYTYDVCNRITGISYPDGTSVGMEWDEVGNLTAVTYPDGLRVDYLYDNFCRLPLPVAAQSSVEARLIPRVRTANRPTSVSWEGGSLGLSYDVAGNLTQVTRPNGVTTDYTYDARQRVASITHHAGAASVVTQSYTYDPWGNPEAMTTDNPLSPPLATAELTTTFDFANQILTRGGTDYTHDEDGNLSAGPSGFSAAFDRANRPTSVTIGGQVQTLTWDAQDNLVTVVAGGVTTRRHYDHEGRLLFTTDAEGAVTTRYIYAGKTLAAMLDASDTAYYLHRDRLGHILALTDATGEVARRWAYQPYGLAATEGDGPQPPFTFVGAHGVLDLGGGIYLMKRRLYDAAAGRFIQRDPQGFNGGPNLYAYASLTPLALIDPGGLEGEEPEYEEQPVMEGTYDIDSNELPQYSTEEDTDEVMYDVAANSVDKAAEIYGTIPGLPGGNFVNAGREYRDHGVTKRMVYELGKGTIGLTGPVGSAVNFGLDAGELAVTEVPKAVKEVKKTEEKARWTIVQGIYDWTQKVTQDFQRDMYAR